MLDGVPGHIVDDSKGLRRDELPFFLRPPAVHLTTGLGILSPLASVEVESADVLRVLKHDKNRVRTPDLACGQAIQSLGNRLLAMAIREQLEDLPHDVGLSWNYGQAIPEGHATSV